MTATTTTVTRRSSEVSAAPALGALFLPAPHTRGHYQHADELARRDCVVCGWPIGYRVAFWFVEPLGKNLAHLACCRHKG